MNRSSILSLTAALAVMGFAANAGATTIIDGSFEQGPATAPNGYYIELGAGNTSITGWTVGGNSIDYIIHTSTNNYWVAADGDRAIDLSGSAPGALSQTLATTVGQSYTVTFDMAGNPDGDPKIKQLSVDVNGLNTKDYSFDDSAVTSYSNLGWTKETYDFTATSTSSVLTFTDLNTGSPYGAALDNVSISANSAVPEPATWGMMLLGFGGLGGVMRSARRKGVVAAA